jgi:hypothetical protein
MVAVIATLAGFGSGNSSRYYDGCRYNALNRSMYSPMPGWVHAFEHPGFKGDCQRFRGEPSGRSYRNDMGELRRVGNDKISTLILGPGTRVVACQNEHHGGQCAEWGPFPTGQRIDGLGALNDQTSELWVYGVATDPVPLVSRKEPKEPKEPRPRP